MKEPTEFCRFFLSFALHFVGLNLPIIESIVIIAKKLDKTVDFVLGISKL